MIDNGYNFGLPGWSYGDFNYSATIDGTDYALIDNAFNNQVGTLAAGSAPASTNGSDVSIPTVGQNEILPNRGSSVPGIDPAVANARAALLALSNWGFVEAGSSIASDSSDSALDAISSPSTLDDELLELLTASD